MYLVKGSLVGNDLLVSVQDMNLVVLYTICLGN